MGKKIVMLVGSNESSRIFYNGLKDSFDIDRVIMETPVAKKDFLKKRINRLGYWTVIGQVLFQLLIVKMLRRFSKDRIREICRSGGLSGAEVTADKLVHVPSVNSDACQVMLQEIKPDIVVVNGTRIISRKILNGIDAIFINTHSGNTPKYRGVHGGYWSLASNDAAHCGVTVHLVDPGIDTGGVLYQQNIKITELDNFVTYGYLQHVEGLKLMRKAISDAIEGNIKTVERNLESKLWYHPTIWQYVYLWLTKGVK